MSKHKTKKLIIEDGTCQPACLLLFL